MQYNLWGQIWGASVKDRSEWPNWVDYNYLTGWIGMLSTEDAETLVVGEASEQELVKQKYSEQLPFNPEIYMVDINRVCQFLDDVFDGPLHDYFFFRLPKLGD